jgi:hypothetical protein
MSEFEGPMKRCTSRPRANLAWFLMAFRVELAEARLSRLLSITPRDRETVVMSLMEVLGEIKGQDPGPKGLLRGPAYQIFESNGTLVQTQFVLNPDF